MNDTDGVSDSLPELVCERFISARQRNNNTVIEFSFRVWRTPYKKLQDVPSWMVCYQVEDGRTKRFSDVLGLDDAEAIARCLMSIEATLFLMETNHEITIADAPYDSKSRSVFYGDSILKSREHLVRLTTVGPMPESG